jgi:hypothetical protein
MTESDDGSYGGWDTVAEVRQKYEAELIAMRLQDAGIEVQVIDQSFEQMPLPDNRDFECVRVLVPVERADEARKILSGEMTGLPADVDVVAEGEEPSE